MKKTCAWIRRSRKDNLGFTTLEVILVVMLIAAVAVAIAPFFWTAVKGWEGQDSRLEVVQVSRMAMDKMIREIKTATDFMTAETSELKFKDWNSADVKYELDVDVLRKNEISMAEPIDALAFTYYDIAGVETSNEEDVYSVKIAMTVSGVTFTSLVVARKDQVADEGVILSKNADFSTEDFTFTTDDTFYIKIWTDQVDYTDIAVAEYQLKKGGTQLEYDLNNNMDNTYTDSVDLSGFATGAWNVRNMEVSDNGGTSYEPDNIEITITSP